MSHTTEQAESGAPIYRYKPRADSPEPVPPVYADGERIAEQIATYVGGSGMVFHELVSTDIHLDVHAMSPSAERPYYTLVTSGMSAKPMNVPDGAPWSPYAELLLCLPPIWKLAQSDLKDLSNYWPILWLKRLSRFPHEYNSWLVDSHTMPNGDPPRPFAPSTKLSGMIIARQTLFPSGMDHLRIDDAKNIDFYAVIPLYTEEMDLKLKQGADALYAVLQKAGVSELLDPHRPNTCERRKRFGFF